MAVIGSLLTALPNQAHAQGISWSGINEGSVITLPSGNTTTNLAITATPSVPSSPTNLIFILERQGSVVQSRTSAPPYAVTLTNLTAGRYFLSAALQATGTPVLGDISFDIDSASLRPANDDWNQAAILASINTTVAGSNALATRQSDEPAPNAASAGKSIWWAWTASANGIFTATTVGSSFDTVLGVYTGTNVTTLTTVGVSDDAGLNAFSQVTFPATNGVTYYFLVDGVTGNATGQAQLRLLAGSPPPIVITAPPDGYLMLLASEGITTNVTATMAITDPSGIARVDYWFDGGTNVSRSGTLAAPYQLNLTNLSVGQYVLTVAAANNAGLVSMTNLGLSVLSLEPILVMERSASTPGKFQMGLTGYRGPKYTLQASTNLEAWCGVSTWTNFPGAVKVADTNVAQFQQRFYRAASVQ